MNKEIRFTFSNGDKIIVTRQWFYDETSDKLTDANFKSTAQLIEKFINKDYSTGIELTILLTISLKVNSEIIKYEYPIIINTRPQNELHKLNFIPIFDEVIRVLDLKKYGQFRKIKKGKQI